MIEAKGSEAEAIRLEWFIQKYQPKIWVVPISNVCFVSLITADDYNELCKGKIPKSLDHWYFKEAINEYFKQRGLPFGL